MEIINLTETPNLEEIMQDLMIIRYLCETNPKFVASHYFVFPFINEDHILSYKDCIILYLTFHAREIPFNDANYLQYFTMNECYLKIVLFNKVNFDQLSNYYYDNVYDPYINKSIKNVLRGN